MGHVERMGEMLNVYDVMTGNLKETDRLKTRHRWTNNIKMDFKEM